MNLAFQDPPDTMVFTSREVVANKEWIKWVFHDLEDGAWQFHSRFGAPETEEEARIVLLRNIVASDPTLLALSDLPLGWRAWRDKPDGAWQRAQT